MRSATVRTSRSPRTSGMELKAAYVVATHDAHWSRVVTCDRAIEPVAAHFTTARCQRYGVLPADGTASGDGPLTPEVT